MLDTERYQNMERFERRHTSKSERHRYECFDDRHERHDIFVFCKELAEYLHKIKAESIIFMDRSARASWVGVDEYWNEHYSETSKPGYYFINPDGFSALGKKLLADQHDVSELFSALLQTGKMPSRATRTREEVAERFSDAHPYLLKERNKATVLFDTCSHTGRTINPVIETLKEVGFTDLHVVTANSSDSFTEVEKSAKIDTYAYLNSCYPFGRGNLVKKGDNVVSERNDDPEDVFFGNLIRSEIRRIMQDKGE